MKKKSVLGVVASKSIGLFIFLILLAAASYLKQFIPSAFYSDIVNFFVDNIGLSFLIFFASIIVGILWSLLFPFNIIAPVAGAASSIFVLTYFFRMWVFLNQYIHSGFVMPADLIYKVVFALVMIFGYLEILAEIRRNKTLEEKEKKREKIERVEEETVEWRDIGEQFKLALFNLGSSLKNIFEPEKKKKRK